MPVRLTKRFRRLPPPLILAALYALLIAVGAALLKLPAAATVPITWSDALFTATSAVTVTGLVVLDTGADLTFFGQAVVAALIQLGGLGLMTFAVLVLAALGLPVGIWEACCSRGYRTTRPPDSRPHRNQQAWKRCADSYRVTLEGRIALVAKSDDRFSRLRLRGSDRPQCGDAVEKLAGDFGLVFTRCAFLIGVDRLLELRDRAVSADRWRWYRCRANLGQFPEVLGGGGECKLVFHPQRPPQPQTAQAEDALQMCKQHLDLLAPI